MTRDFSASRWSGAPVTFVPAGAAALLSGPPFAVLVFAFHNGRIVLADIIGRGWCVPSGRIEPGETAEAAARREAMEEAGLSLEWLTPLGYTVLSPAGKDAPRIAQNFTASVSGREALPAGFESAGVRLVTREELPGCYYFWDDLVAAIFDFAWERHAAESAARSVG